MNKFWGSHSAGKEFASSVGDRGSIPGLGRSPGEEKGYPLQYSGLENSMDSIVHGVAKSQTGVSDFHLHYSMVTVVNNTYLTSAESGSQAFSHL